MFHMNDYSQFNTEHYQKKWLVDMSKTLPSYYQQKKCKYEFLHDHLPHVFEIKLTKKEAKAKESLGHMLVYKYSDVFSGNIKLRAEVDVEALAHNTRDSWNHHGAKHQMMKLVKTEKSVSETHNTLMESDFFHEF